VRDRRVVDLPRTTVILDRSPQILPVPLGGLAPARRQTAPWIRWWRRHQPTVLTVIAIAAIGIAAWVSTSPRSFSVALRGGDVSVDGTVLTAAGHEQAIGTRVFTGDGSLAITAGASGTVHAGAVMIWKDLPTTGQCVLHVVARSATETCEFAIGADHVASIDGFDFAAGAWNRHYTDGIEVTIAVPAGTALIPIPFPLGR
jgi:hypothetical protein